MGIIMRNGNAYGGAYKDVEGEDNQIILSDGKEWLKPCDFKIFSDEKSATIEGDLKDQQYTFHLNIKQGQGDLGRFEFGNPNQSILQSENGNAGQTLPCDLKITDHSRLVVTDQSVIDIGHGVTQHIYDNVYIDMDGINGNNSTNLQHIAEGNGGGNSNQAPVFPLGFNNASWSLSGSYHTHKLNDGPTILMHGTPFINIESSQQSAPTFLIHGGCYFDISDGLGGSGGTKPRWTATSSQQNGVTKKSLGLGSSTGMFSSGELGPVVKLGQSPTIVMDGSSYFKMLNNATIQMEGAAAIIGHSNGYLEIDGACDVRFRDNSEIDMQGSSLLNMKNGVIEMNSKQIYFTTETWNTESRMQFLTSTIMATNALSPFSKITNNFGENDDQPHILFEGANHVLLTTEKNGLNAVRIGSQNQSTTAISVDSQQNSETILNLASSQNGQINIKGQAQNSYLNISMQPNSLQSFNYVWVNGTRFNQNNNQDKLVKTGDNTHINGGSVQYILEGINVFMQHEGFAHAEMHDFSKFIMRGALATRKDEHAEESVTDTIDGYHPWSDGKTKFGTKGHLDEDWSRPVSSIDDSPIFQMYEGSNFLMRGKWDRYPTYKQAIKITFSGEPKYEKIEDLFNKPNDTDKQAIETAMKEMEWVSGGKLEKSEDANTVTISNFKYKPKGWKEHPTKAKDASLLELYDNAEVRIGGDTKILIDNDSITINETVFTMEELKTMFSALKALVKAKSK